MKTVEEMLNSDTLGFNIGTVLAHIDPEDNSLSCCQILEEPTQHQTVLVRFENEVLARFVSLDELYNFD